MTEPASTTAGAIVAWKLGLLHKLAALAGAGAVGAALIACVEPPANRMALFLRALVAGICSMLFTLPVVRALDYYMDWINLSADNPTDWLEVALPVAFVVGALSWGVVGALAKLRDMIRDRGALAVGAKAGLTD